MTGSVADSFQIRSEQRGFHWVAWLTRGGDPKPVLAVLLVGQTQKEAETRARAWSAEVAGYAPERPRAAAAATAP